ncbi:MAG: LuxR C-terminal-related transcriptional regulator [Candidatus Berkelbacteria bacterium]|nr:LuxR C-terminal-related transcriptional regulator [Candidatus Berkelbacteria bacterium]
MSSTKSTASTYPPLEIPLSTSRERRSDITGRGVRLSKREIEVLSLIAEGHCSKEAADVLFVSKRTIDFHLANIFDKLQVNNRVQAYRAAMRLGLIPYETPFATRRETVPAQGLVLCG